MGGWGAGINVDRGGRDLIACFIYFLMLTRAEYRRSTGFLRRAGDHTKELETPTADLHSQWGGGGCSVWPKSPPPPPPSACMPASYLMRIAREQGASLKGATFLSDIKLSSRPLSLLSSLTLRTWGTWGTQVFEQ